MYIIALATIPSNAGLKLARWIVIGDRRGTGKGDERGGNVMEMTHHHFPVFVFDYILSRQYFAGPEINEGNLCAAHPVLFK